MHSFVRKGSVVSESQIFDLDTGEQLKTYTVTGKDVNALGYYPNPAPDDEVVVQAELPHVIEAGQSVRVRVIETYTDPKGYTVKNGELTWDRTLGRPRNEVALPAGWMTDGSDSSGYRVIGCGRRASIAGSRIRAMTRSTSF